MIKSRELEIERIAEINALGRVKEDWNALLENNETRTVELTYEWQVTYWKHFHEDSELFVLVVREAGSVIAIAPLRLTRIRRFGLRARTLEFIAARESNYQDFVIGDNKGEVLECIADYLMDNVKSWDILNLTHVPETSTTAHFFLNRLGRSLPCRVHVERCTSLKIDKTWEEYAASSRKTRGKIAYRLRRLRELGGGEIACFHCSDEEQFRSHLLKFFELHRKRWNQTETPSQFNDDRCCKFYLEIVPQLLPRRQVDLFVLKAGDTLVALLYSFLFDRDCLVQLIAYDTEYSKGAPSLVMHELFVRQAFADGVKVVDFGSYFPYKEYWADRFRSRLDIEIYPKRLLPCSIYVLARSIDALRVNLKRITPLRQSVRYVQQKVRLHRNRHLVGGSNLDE
jgi:CelD/BcsL family acetyltransferase involved in cellulose biosynthesis